MELSVCCSAQSAQELFEKTGFCSNCLEPTIFYTETEVNMSKITIDIQDLCTHCGKDTAFGSGELLFVNRVPSGSNGKLIFADKEFNVDIDGYMCVQCQSVECDDCGCFTADYLTTETDEYCLTLCEDCGDKRGITGE